MENAVDALKMAGAAALFIIAFSVAMFMFGRARQTTDDILDRLKLEDFYAKVEPLNNNVTRKVGIETVIPTIYRYAQADANIRIRILDPNGKEHQVFDQNLDTDVAKAAATVPGSSNDTPYYAALRKQYDDANGANKATYLYQAPWRNQNDSSYRIERINAYIYGTKMKHMENVSYDKNDPLSKNHGLLELISNSGNKGIFEESYIEYNISGTVEKDEYGEEVVTKPASTKTIITYKLLN